MRTGSGRRNVSTLAGIFRRAGQIFFDHAPFQLAAALSYYSLLSMAPLLLVVTGLAGLLLGQDTVQQALIDQMRRLIGQEGASLVATVVANADRPERGIVSMAVGGTLILLGATTVFAQLQSSLNECWDVRPQPTNAIMGFVRARAVSFGVLLGVGFLLLVSLVLSAVMSALHNYIDRHLPGGPVLWQLVNLAVSLGLLALLIAALFRYIPDAQVAWRDTWLGALCTAVLMSIGKFAIGVYLGQASVGSAYGAAGSAVVLMVWVYYASLILFFGAVLTRAIADQRGAPLIPRGFAHRIHGEAGS